jgi:hypothetical protein
MEARRRNHYHQSTLFNEQDDDKEEELQTLRIQNSSLLVTIRDLTAENAHQRAQVFRRVSFARDARSSAVAARGGGGCCVDREACGTAGLRGQGRGPRATHSTNPRAGTRTHSRARSARPRTRAVRTPRTPLTPRLTASRRCSELQQKLDEMTDRFNKLEQKGLEASKQTQKLKDEKKALKTLAKQFKEQSEKLTQVGLTCGHFARLTTTCPRKSRCCGRSSR